MLLMLAGVVLFPLALLGLVLVMATLEDSLEQTLDERGADPVEGAAEPVRSTRTGGV